MLTFQRRLERRTARCSLRRRGRRMEEGVGWSEEEPVGSEWQERASKDELSEEPPTGDASVARRKGRLARA